MSTSAYTFLFFSHLILGGPLSCSLQHHFCVRQTAIICYVNNASQRKKKFFHWCSVTNQKNSKRGQIQLDWMLFFKYNIGRGCLVHSNFLFGNSCTCVGFVKFNVTVESRWLFRCWRVWVQTITALGCGLYLALSWDTPSRNWHHSIVSLTSRLFRRSRT